MIEFFSKIRKHGTKKIFVLVLIRVFNFLRGGLYRFIFSDNSPEIHGAKINLPTQFVGEGNIELEGCQLGVWPSPYFLAGGGYLEARSKTAEIYIGRDTVINNNYVIIADKSSINIGQRCLIGPNFFVADSDFHGIKVVDRVNGNYLCRSVFIGDDVFIGADVKILKGVKINNGAVIGSGSVVVSDVDAMAVYVGIPAKKIFKINC